MEKKVLKFFLQKKTFFTEKNINENVKIYLSFEKYILMQKMFVLQIKYKSFLNICSFCKKKFFDHRNKLYLLKLRCELNNLVLKVLEAPNLWYFLN